MTLPPSSRWQPDGVTHDCFDLRNLSSLQVDDDLDTAELAAFVDHRCTHMLGQHWPPS